MQEQLHHGLKAIAARLAVSERKARAWIRKGYIRAFREPGTAQQGPWCITETELCQDLKRFRKLAEGKR